MTLTQRITDLASSIAREFKSRITASHPGVAKAWVSFGCEVSNGQTLVVIRCAFNVATVERLSVGQFRVVFGTPMVDASYCWQSFSRNAGNQSSMKQASARQLAEEKTPEFVEVICTTAAGTLSDTSEMNVTVWR